MSTPRRSQLPGYYARACLLAAGVLVVLSLVSNGCSRSASDRKEEGGRDATESGRPTVGIATSHPKETGDGEGRAIAVSTERAKVESQDTEVQASILTTTVTSAPNNDIKGLVKVANGPDGVARQKAVGGLLGHLVRGTSLAGTQAILGPAAQTRGVETSRGQRLVTTYYVQLIKGPKGRQLMTVEFERRNDQWEMIEVRGPHLPNAR